MGQSQPPRGTSSFTQANNAIVAFIEYQGLLFTYQQSTILGVSTSGIGMCCSHRNSSRDHTGFVCVKNKHPWIALNHNTSSFSKRDSPKQHATH